ncbi:glycosyltransferase [Acetobacter sacchari]|uniref:Glycosyltransferase n=1 Tax=Acetobacter sacchari TaxID=2661687 RepID=A0ABS3LSE7_9PROT|nr:glycosyltransferase [Acetobacter sacchari]MBO1358831.1 glycosyltransferase [Acetobacter sacchari]
MSRVLIWQWGRRGGGPRFALDLARSLHSLPKQEVLFSPSRRAEILSVPAAQTLPLCPVDTYDSVWGLAGRLLTAPVMLLGLRRRLSSWRPDFAICAMVGPLDLLMALILQRLRVPFAVIVHDAVTHPGDGFPLQMTLQRALLRRADVIVALTRHVAAQLREQPTTRMKDIIVASHPPFNYDVPPPDSARLREPGPLRLLMFGRLLPYKGFGMLAEALADFPPELSFECRIVGKGPDSEPLRTLSSVPQVTVENRWVPEEEIGSLVEWADVIVLPYTEASQSGVGAIGLAAGRWIVATNVGGLTEQFRNQPQAALCDPNASSLRAALIRMIKAQPRPPVPLSTENDTAWRAMAEQLLVDLAAHGLPVSGSIVSGAAASEASHREITTQNQGKIGVNI